MYIIIVLCDVILLKIIPYGHTDLCVSIYCILYI